MSVERASRGPQPPGPDGLPFVGVTREFAKDRLGFVTRMAEEYGDVVRSPVAGGDAFYGLYHPDHIRYVLVENNQNYVKGEIFQRQLSLLGEGVLNAEGERWRRQRHMVEPAFHPNRIAGYEEPMTDFTERLVDDYTDGEVRNVHGDMMTLTLEIVAHALFDVDIREAQDDVGRALETVMAHSRRRSARLVNIPDWVPTPGNVQYLRAANALDSIVSGIIEERRDGDDDSLDVVSMLMTAEDESGEGMTDEQIHDEVMTLLLAGHETTAQALTYTWYLLATHPEVEQRLLAELDEVLAGDTPTVADLTALTYTEKVIRESMRLYPPVWGLLREPIADDEIDGYRIPAGKSVGVFQWVTHRDPRFYDDPLAFQPERWTDDFRRNLHPFAYFPFGGGPRRCLGDRFALQESRLVLATMAQSIHFEAIPSTDLELEPAITLRPANGLRMRVHRR